MGNGSTNARPNRNAGLNNIQRPIHNPAPSNPLNQPFMNPNFPNFMNVLAPPHPMGNMLLNQPRLPPNNHNPQSQINVHNPTKIMVMNNDISLRKKSLELKQKSGSKNVYELSFAFDALSPVEVFIYLLADEKKEPTSNVTLDITPRQQQDTPVQSYLFQSAGTNKVIEKACEINFEKLQKSSFESIKDNFYPLIIKFERKKEGEKKIIYNYGIITTDEGKFVAKIKRQKMQLGTQVFEIDEIYGISSSGLTDNEKDNEAAYMADQEKECVVCFSEKIDTVIMTCRHMCLCIGCAQALQNSKQPQARKCPICRKDIESFIRIKRDEKKT